MNCLKNKNICEVVSLFILRTINSYFCTFYMILFDPKKFYGGLSSSSVILNPSMFFLLNCIVGLIFSFSMDSKEIMAFILQNGMGTSLHDNILNVLGTLIAVSVFSILYNAISSKITDISNLIKVFHICEYGSTFYLLALLFLGVQTLIFNMNDSTSSFRILEHLVRETLYVSDSMSMLKVISIGRLIMGQNVGEWLTPIYIHGLLFLVCSSVILVLWARNLYIGLCLDDMSQFIKFFGTSIALILLIKIVVIGMFAWYGVSRYIEKSDVLIGMYFDTEMESFKDSPNFAKMGYYCHYFASTIDNDIKNKYKFYVLAALYNEIAINNEMNETVSKREYDGISIKVNSIKDCDEYFKLAKTIHDINNMKIETSEIISNLNLKNIDIPSNIDLSTAKSIENYENFATRLNELNKQIKSVELLRVKIDKHDDYIYPPYGLLTEFNIDINLPQVLKLNLIPYTCY